MFAEHGQVSLSVTHHEACPSPLLSENCVNNMWILAAMRPIDLVVSGHETDGMTDPDSLLERNEVDLAQRPLGDNGVDRHSLMLLVVANKVLQGRRTFFNCTPLQ